MNLLKARQAKAKEVVMLLDLFNGSITLNELLTVDINIINLLKQAKKDLMIAANEAKEKKQIQQQTYMQNQNVKKPIKQPNVQQVLQKANVKPLRRGN